MKIYNRLIAVLAAVTLCFSSICVAFADDAAVTDEVQYDANFTQEARVLGELGIEDLPTSGTWDSVRITKGEFLRMALQLSNYDSDVYYETALPYADVSEESTYYNEFAYAYLNDMLYDDEYMYPDDSLTRYFAVEVVRGILGYNVKADGKLIWNKSGIEQQIVKGVRFGDMNITSLNGAIKLLYNAIDIDILQESAVGPTESEYKIQKGVKVLSQLEDIYKVEGRLQATPIASLTGTVVPDETIIVDGIEYSTADTSLYFMIGSGVSGYYKLSGGKRNLILLDETDSVVKVTVDAADIQDITTKAVKYSKDGKSKTISLKDPTIIYNGRELSSGEYTKYQKTILNITQGDITLYNSGSGYNLMVVRSFANLVAASKKQEGFIVYDSLDNSHSLSLDEKDYKLFVLSDQYGNAVGFDSISSGSVITYAKSLDGKVLEAVYGGMTITTSLSKINTSGGDTTITVSGKSYTVLKSVKTKFDLGVIYTLYVNAAGYVCGVEEASQVEGNLGYVIGIKPAGGLDANLKIKIIDSSAVDEDDAKILECTEKLVVDGKPYSDSTEAETALKRFNGTENFPVIYKLSQSGRITNIDTPFYDSENEPEMSLRQRHSRDDSALIAKTMMGWGYRNLIDGKYYLSIGGMCLLLQTDGSVLVADRAKNDTSYKMDLFSIGDETIVMSFVVADGSLAASDFVSGMFIVEDIGRELNSKGNETYVIKARDGENEVTYYVAEKYSDSADIKDVQIGDILRCKVDGRNEITEIESLLKYSDKESSVGNMNYPRNTNTEFRVVIGKVYSVEEDPNCKTANNKIVSFYTNPNDMFGSMESLFLRSGRCAIYECERGNLVIKDIDVNQILAYKEVGDDADVIIATNNYCVPTNIYIVK